MSPAPSSPGSHPEADLRQLQKAAERAGVVLTEDALQAFQQGHLLEAIKRIRRANPGLDLARAKAVLDRMQAQARTTGADAGRQAMAAGKQVLKPQQRPPTVVMGERPGQLRWLLIVVALLAAAIWLVFDGRW